jgi:hypothetical protein
MKRLTINELRSLANQLEALTALEKAGGPHIESGRVLTVEEFRFVVVVTDVTDL